MACIFLAVCPLLAMPATPLPVPDKPAPALQVPHADAPVIHDSWMDEWQDNLTSSMNYTVQQVDNFFALKGADQYNKARAQGRISLGWEPRSRDMSEFDLRFKIRVKLPALENRVDLLLSDDENFDNQASIKAARQPIQRRSDNTTIALAYRASDDAKLSYRLGTGRRGQIYAKTRFEDMAAWSNQLALFYDAEAYYYNRDEFGAELGATIQYISRHDHVFRFNNRYFYRDMMEDWIWRHEAQYLHPIDEQAAMIYTLFVEGGTEPENQVGEVYTSAKWRSNPLREWLFFELEPFVLFLRDEDFKPSYGMAMRVEVYYGG
ncbi:hypothetical protein [Salinimonas lutimaris]|uniref:hypothetical protein n=1 Tax=Salinimonas lutimaris TaxID=914153 RepID=UPI0010BF9060|nr:hypothetical protein [Salinimonas lutimaris]